MILNLLKTGASGGIPWGISPISVIRSVNRPREGNLSIASILILIRIRIIANIVTVTISIAILVFVLNLDIILEPSSAVVHTITGN
ncbi:MAG: hypothetical protein DBX05_07275 [Candidatus Poseidoniales archaeon]|nr:MAG: hypothetical protein DBX05_07275 [Candidatus Poseidoniales archaeon]